MSDWDSVWEKGTVAQSLHYDLLKHLDEHGDGAETRVQYIAKDFYGWTDDPEAVEGFSEELQMFDQAMKHARTQKIEAVLEHLTLEGLVEKREVLRDDYFDELDNQINFKENLPEEAQGVSFGDETFIMYRITDPGRELIVE